jgi:hypothetical protein
MRSAITLSTVLLSALVRGQWDLPKPLLLDGPLPQQRQVTGLAAPSQADAGVNVDAARNLSTTFVQVDGAHVLTGALQPAPAAYSAGMCITILPAVANASGAQLELNGLGPVPIVKRGGLPLDSADLAIGTPHRLLFDGTRFQVISPTSLPCPAGFHIGAREYCVEDSSHVPLDFAGAGADCQQRGARLCTFSEWLHACLSQPAFIGTVLDFEWVDHAANSNTTVKRVGRGSNGTTPDDSGIGCTNGHNADRLVQTRYRCCYSR